MAGKLALPLASSLVSMLETVDKPLRRLDVRIKTLIGWAAIATMGTAMLTLVWAALRG